eukprot:2574446-Pyramimonas_sp.AAC.1
MKTECVEELSEAEMACYGQALDANPGRPALRWGKEGGQRVHACSNCAAKRDGIDEREAAAKAARLNEGVGSIQHSRDRE